MEHGAGVAFTEEANSLAVDLGRVCFKDQRSTEHVEDGPKNTRSARASARPASGRVGIPLAATDSHRLAACATRASIG
jgi:hypothetical protein